MEGSEGTKDAPLDNEYHQSNCYQEIFYLFNQFNLFLSETYLHEQMKKKITPLILFFFDLERGGGGYIRALI